MSDVEEKYSAHVFSEGVDRLTAAISHLEGQTYGAWFQFSAHGYIAQLHHCIGGGWSKVDGFAGLPELDEFAHRLTEAMQPVVDWYATRLRLELANECCDLAAHALKRLNREKGSGT